MNSYATGLDRFVKPHTQWRVVRVWPKYFSWLGQAYDYLVLGKSIYSEEGWYDSYVSDTPEFGYLATIFDDYDYACMVAMIMQTRWPCTSFYLEEV